MSVDSWTLTCNTFHWLQTQFLKTFLPLQLHKNFPITTTQEITQTIIKTDSYKTIFMSPIDGAS